MSNNKTQESRAYDILVYGIERKGLTAHTQQLKQRNYTLHFEPFNTDKRINEFDGVIMYQGIFEDRVFKFGRFTEKYRSISCHKNELDKRSNEIQLLLNNRGFICFLLCEDFLDKNEYQTFKTTDLTKQYLSFDDLYRHNFVRRIPNIISKRSEFSRFLGIYGAASSWFEIRTIRLEWRKLAEANSKVVGMIFLDCVFFVPSLIPDNTSDRLEEYFKLLAEALTSTVNKFSFDVPAWADEFQFGEEKYLIDQRNQLLKDVSRFEKQIKEYRRFKRVLLADGEALVDAVVDTFRRGFGFKVNDDDEYKEDIKILNESGKPIIFGENELPRRKQRGIRYRITDFFDAASGGEFDPCWIKGTNAGVKREFVNQVDSHRERAGLSSDFPAILIINSHIKNARNLEEKDKEVVRDQVRHAEKLNVLVLRTLDLLRLLELFKTKKITKAMALELLTKNVGWLKVEIDSWKVIKG